MSCDPNKHHRRSIRLKGYDYSLAGAYFVTICMHQKKCQLGDVVDGVMRSNEGGLMVERWWLELARKFPAVYTDAYVIMPNHVHGILVISDTMTGEPSGKSGEPVNRANTQVRPYVCPNNGCDQPGRRCDQPDELGEHTGSPLRVCPNGPGSPLPQVVKWFKTMTTNAYIRGVKTLGWPPFSEKLWQRNYYEHIIRDNESFELIREYIANNPLQWQFDRENPGRVEACLRVSEKT